METTTNRIYCSAADLQMTPYISFSKFRENLILNLLFYGELVIPDGFLLTSPHSIQDILKGKDKSILLEGLKLGLIQPTFREEVSGSFKNALNVIKDQGIIGPIEHSDKVAQILDSNVRSSEKYEFEHWPKTLVGHGFLKEVRNTLGQSDPYFSDKAAIRIWKETKKWRTDLIDDAVAKTTDDTLRRGELLNLVAKEVGWEEGYSVPNLQAAIKAARKRKKTRLKTYMQWINQCYHRNHAKQFKIYSSAFSGKGLEQLAVFDKDTKQSNKTKLNFFTNTVYIPSIPMLKTLSLSKVLSVRESNEANEYFESWANWRKKPSKDTAKELAESLESYADLLRRDYLHLLKKKVVQALRFDMPTPISKEEQYWLDTAWKAIGQIPVVGQVIFFLEGSWGFLRTYAPVRADSVKQVMLGAKLKPLTIELPPKADYIPKQDTQVIK